MDKHTGITEIVLSNTNRKIQIYSSTTNPKSHGMKWHYHGADVFFPLKKADLEKLHAALGEHLKATTH